MSAPQMRGAVTRLVDIVFPGDANHHGTLFGGAGLAHMDKLAFIVASRHGHVDFVTASCERIDFKAPAHIGEIVELSGRVARVGMRSLVAEVELVAEATLSAERRLCARGVFNMVAVGESVERICGRLPQLTPAAEEEEGALRMADLVFPGDTSHYGSLYGGVALAAMGKAAFVAATRHCRKTVVMASSRRVDFESQIATGELVELVARVAATGRSSLTVEVDLFAENLQSAERRLCARGAFVMVAVDTRHRPVELDASAA